MKTFFHLSKTKKKKKVKIVRNFYSHERIYKYIYVYISIKKGQNKIKRRIKTGFQWEIGADLDGNGRLNKSFGTHTTLGTDLIKF